MRRRSLQSIIVLLCMNSMGLYAQERNIRYSLGGGLSFTENVQGVYVLGKMDYKRNIFELRCSNNENLFETDEGSFFLSSIDENTFFYLTDFSLLYGYDFLKSDRHMLVLSTGILYSFGKYRDNCIDQSNDGFACFEYNDDQFGTFGIPARFSFTYKTKRRIGYEISGFYNFFKYDYYGGTIGVVVDISKR